MVTRYPRSGPIPGTRRIDGVIVDLGVIDADEYLRHARTLTHVVAAGGRPVHHDPHRCTIPTAGSPGYATPTWPISPGPTGHVFASLAREAWLRAQEAQARARRLAEWFETDAAMVVLAEARLGVAMVEGLLTRTYFRDSAGRRHPYRRLVGPYLRTAATGSPRRRRSWPGAAARSTVRSPTCSVRDRRPSGDAGADQVADPVGDGGGDRAQDQLA